MKTSLWLFGLLLISLTGAYGLDKFPENFVVAKVNDAVTLTCRTNEIEGVIWKHDDQEYKGLNLFIPEVISFGEYSCSKDGKKLSSTWLLLEEEEEDETRKCPVICRAKSYDCNFSCYFNCTGYRVRFGMGQNCSKNAEPCTWVNSGQEVDNISHFELPHNLSSHAEESTMLKVTAEAFNEEEFTFLQTTKEFYLRDIVQPDSPQIVGCETRDNDVNVTIIAASSWSTPHSFFSLEHQIEYRRRDDGELVRSSSNLLPRDISELRARSRDSLVHSQWGEWSSWKNVRTEKKQLCKCKNKEKSCCPELPPGYLDKCKKRRKKNKKKQSQTS